MKRRTYGGRPAGETSNSPHSPDPSNKGAGEFDLAPTDPVAKKHEVDQRLSELVVLLKSGLLRQVIPKLQSLLRWGGPHAGVHFNLGLALSQEGRFQEAVVQLSKCLELDPTHVNALVGLGTAYGRMGEREKAMLAFERAVQAEPENPYALRNLGASYLERDELEKAKEYMERARKILINDPQVNFGLAAVSEAMGIKSGDHNELKRAELYYKEVIDLDPESQVAEQARMAMTAMAHRTMRSKSPMRPDVMMYILGALDRFDGISRSQVGEITMEIALLGRSGLRINDSSRKYKLKTISGKEFTGLHLLAIMYVGIRQLNGPVDDLATDFGVEYDAALSLFKSRKSGPSSDSD